MKYSSRLLFAAVISLSFLSLPTVAATPDIKPAHLSVEESADVSRIETYLNEMKSISADFLQIDDGGGMMRGTIAIQRPGKMRVNYDAPSKDFIIADGTAVHIWNDDLQQQTNVDQGSSLAEFILRDPIKLNGDITVTKFQRFPAKMELTLVQANDAGAGQLTLVFEDHPLKLRQWKVLDAQGRTTGVNLENMREGIAFPAKLFYFVPPNFGTSTKSAAP